MMRNAPAAARAHAGRHADPRRMHAARGSGGSRARVHRLIMYLVRGTPDKVFELIFIELLSRYGAVNARGCSQGFWRGMMDV